MLRWVTRQRGADLQERLRCLGVGELLLGVLNGFLRSVVELEKLLLTVESFLGEVHGDVGDVAVKLNEKIALIDVFAFPDFDAQNNDGDGQGDEGSAAGWSCSAGAGMMPTKASMYS